MGPSLHLKKLRCKTHGYQSCQSCRGSRLHKKEHRRDGWSDPKASSKCQDKPESEARPSSKGSPCQSQDHRSKPCCPKACTETGVSTCQINHRSKGLACRDQSEADLHPNRRTKSGPCCPSEQVQVGAGPKFCASKSRDCLPILAAVQMEGCLPL